MKQLLFRPRLVNSWLPILVGEARQACLGSSCDLKERAPIPHERQQRAWSCRWLHRPEPELDGDILVLLCKIDLRPRARIIFLQQLKLSPDIIRSFLEEEMLLTCSTCNAIPLGLPAERGISVRVCQVPR